MRLAMTTALPDRQTSERKSDVVLIHGTGSGSAMWKPLVKDLTAAGHRCFLIDLRGHGDSPEPKEKTDIAVHQKDVLETLSASDVVFPAVFIGHSLGAIISVTMAEERPELFERIFAAAMPGKIFPPLVWGFSLLLRLPYEKLRGTAFHRSLSWRPRTLISTDRFTLEQICENFANLNYISRPFNIKLPVHFAAGREDPVAMYFYVKRIHKLVPDSTFLLFEMAGHNFMDMYPGKFNSWVLYYLAQSKGDQNLNMFLSQPQNP